MRKTRCELPIKRAREAGGWWVWPPSPSGLPAGPPSPGGVVVGLNAVPNHGSCPSGRWSHGLVPERGMVYHLTTSHPGAAGCGRVQTERRSARGEGRAERSKFRPGVCAGLDPFSARQFSALPI